MDVSVLRCFYATWRFHEGGIAAIALTPEQLGNFAKALAALHRPLVLTHTKADGDALGALVAMRCALRRLGAEPTAIMFDPLPATYAVFERFEPLPVFGCDLSPAALAANPPDGVVILDTCALGQLEPLADWLRRFEGPRLVVDHHQTRDPIASLELVDERAAAACLILHDLWAATDWELHGEAAEALFIGIATDTGWFTHSNTDARVFAASHALCRTGVIPNALYQAIYQNKPVSRVRLRAAALASLFLEHEGGVAVMTLQPEDFERTGGRLSETENIINDALEIAGVQVAVLLIEHLGGPIRVSLRSREPHGGGPEVDVASIAATLGGGGHRRASGAKLAGLGMEEARARVLTAIAAHWSDGVRQP